MPIPRLHADTAALLVIDVQERLMPAIAGADQVIANAAVLLRMAEAIQIPYLVTEQYPKGLGRTVEPVAAAMADRSRRVEKTRFSAMVDVVEEQLRRWRRPSVIVCGVEAHVCVLQTVLDLQATGWQSFVCTDAVSASSGQSAAEAYQRMTAAGAVLSRTISIMYELLEDATNPVFRSCLELAKQVAPDGSG
jgi:nicotinamidase-related amidase